MDQVCIQNIKTEATIGVYDFEHQAPQPLLIDLELTTNFSLAFISDSLEDTIDYENITKMVQTFCKTSRYALLETLAGGIIQLLFNSQAIQKIAICIRKPKALKDAVASIRCERSREDI